MYKDILVKSNNMWANHFSLFIDQLVIDYNKPSTIA